MKLWANTGLVLVCVSLTVCSAGKSTIAILDLKSTTIEANLLVPLANRLSSEIVKTDIYTVVERGEMEAVLREQGFQQSGCTDASCAIQAGQLLNVNFIITGTVDKLGAIYSINVRMVDVATGEIVRNISDDCVDCSIDDFVMKTVRRAALKLAGLEAADNTDDKVSDALKMQHFLYKGRREGNLGSITFDVKPVQSRVVFDDSAYGSGKILIENVPVKKHQYKVVPESRRFMPDYGTVRISSGEIADVSVGLRKAYFNIGAAFAMELFDGKFSMPTDTFSVRTTDRYDSVGALIPAATVPVIKEIQNSGAVPATVITSVIGIETPRSYYSIVSHIPFGNIFAIPDRVDHDRDRPGVNSGRLVFQGNTLYYSTYVYRSFASYFSYVRKILNFRDILSVNAGLNAGFGITRMVIDFYKFESANGQVFYNYNKELLSSGSTIESSPYGSGSGSGEFSMVEHGQYESFFRINQFDFGGPVIILTAGSPRGKDRYFIHYMLGLGANESESDNVKSSKFTVVNEFKTGVYFRF